MSDKNIKFNNSSIYLLLLISMLYITLKLTCNTLFFRQTLFTVPFTHLDIRIVSSAFVYPSIYVVSDALVALSNRRIAIIVAIIGIVCDGLFSFSTFFVTNLAMPVITGAQQANTFYINQLGPHVWELYYHGLAAATTAAIAEIVIFSFILKRSGNFFISTISSVIITLLAHNTVTDYPMLKSDPDAWKIIFNGLGMNISIMAIYAAIISVLLFIMKKWKTSNK